GAGGRDDDGAGARDDRPRRAPCRPHDVVHHARVRVPAGGRTAHELPSAALDAARARDGFCRDRGDAAPLPGRGRGALPLLLVRRRDVDRLSVEELDHELEARVVKLAFDGSRALWAYAFACEPKRRIDVPKDAVRVHQPGLRQQRLLDDVELYGELVEAPAPETRRPTEY